MASSTVTHGQCLTVMTKAVDHDGLQMALRVPKEFILFFMASFSSFINAPAALLQSINMTGGLDASACSQEEDVI